MGLLDDVKPVLTPDKASFGRQCYCNFFVVARGNQHTKHACRASSLQSKADRLICFKEFDYLC